MKRRDFLLGTLSWLATLPFLSLLFSCDGEVTTGGTSGNCTANGSTVSIGTNHGHTLTVTAADITAGVEKSYSILGSGGHDHTVTLTAAHFTTLQSNTAVVVTSGTGGGHTHTVTVACA